MTHRATVRVYHEGAIFNPGASVDYVGPLDWKYEPIDPAKHEAWLADAAKPDQVETTRWQQDGRDPALSALPGALASAVV